MTVSVCLTNLNEGTNISALFLSSDTLIFSVCVGVFVPFENLYHTYLVFFSNVVLILLTFNVIKYSSQEAMRYLKLKYSVQLRDACLFLEQMCPVLT